MKKLLLLKRWSSPTGVVSIKLWHKEYSHRGRRNNRESSV